MKLLCDAMLAHVGKRLRSAGYDTRIDKGQLADRNLLAIAVHEDRVFLTCDREIAQINSAAKVLYLASNEESAWARFLAKEAHVDWTHAPFTLCLECNTRLRATDLAQALLVPENIRREGKGSLYCPTCERVYWYGSHVDGMKTHLEALKQLST